VSLHRKGYLQTAPDIALEKESLRQSGSCAYKFKKNKQRIKIVRREYRYRRPKGRNIKLDEVAIVRLTNGVAL